MHTVMSHAKLKIITKLCSYFKLKSGRLYTTQFTATILLMAIVSPFHSCFTVFSCVDVRSVMPYLQYNDDDDDYDDY